MSDNQNEWNAMQSDYNDPAFNNYTNGPGGKLEDELQPGTIAKYNKSINRTTVALHLKNIPAELNQNGVENLCSKFGRVVEVKRYRDTAIVNGANLTEATNILRAINEHKDLGMTAAFARIRETNGNNSDEMEMHEKRSYPKNNESKRPIINLNNRKIKGPFTNPIALSSGKQNNRKSYSSDNTMDSTTNEFMDLTVSNFPKDHAFNVGNVSNGRYYYRDSENFSNSLTVAKNGTFDKQIGTYTFQTSSGHPISFPQLGHCVVCSTVTDKYCKPCGEPYCSKVCQKRDWPKHRSECEAIPELASDTPSTVQMKYPICAQNEYDIKTAARALQEPPKNGRNYESKKERQQNNVDEKSIYSDSDGDPARTMNKSLAIRERQRITNEQYENLSNSSNPGMDKTYENVKTIKSTPSGSSGLTSPSQPSVQKPKPKPNIKMEIAPPPKSKAIVSITASIDHKILYIRSMEPNDNAEYIKNINDILKYSETAQDLRQLPENGDVILAKFEDDYYRALVIAKTGPTSVKVAFLDYGNMEEKQLIDLKELSDDLQTRKRYPIRLVLHNVPNVLCNDNVMDYISELINNCTPLKLTYDGVYDLTENKTIDLIDDEFRSISKQITQLNIVNESADDDKVIYKKDIPAEILDGENINVIVLDNSLLAMGMISVIKESDFETLSQNEQRFREYCNNSKCERYTPRIGEICLVKHNKQWYRGECIELAGDGHPSIVFIDYGNISIVKIENIRKMPAEFAFKCRTISCGIDDIPDMPDSDHILELSENVLYQRLKMLIPTNERLKIAKAEESKGGEATISLPNIIDILIKEKLLEIEQ